MGTSFERGVMTNRRSEGGKKKEKKKEVAGDDDWGGLREAEGRGQPFDDGTECGDARKQEREQLIGQMGLEVGTKRRQRAPSAASPGDTQVALARQGLPGLLGCAW